MHLWILIHKSSELLSFFVLAVAQLLFTDYIGKIQNRNLYIYVFLVFKKKSLNSPKGVSTRNPQVQRKRLCNHSIAPPCSGDREPEPAGAGGSPTQGGAELGAGFLQGCPVLCTVPFLLPHHFPPPSSFFILRIRAGIFSCIA